MPPLTSSRMPEKETPRRVGRRPLPEVERRVRIAIFLRRQTLAEIARQVGSREVTHAIRVAVEKIFEPQDAPTPSESPSAKKPARRTKGDRL